MPTTYRRPLFARPDLILLTVLLSALLIASFTPSYVQAAPGVELSEQSALVRFKTAIRFTVKGKVSDSSVQSASLKLRFGKTNTLKDYDGKVTADKGAFTVDYTYDISRYERNVAVGMNIGYSWLIRLASGTVYSTPEQNTVYEDGIYQWRQIEGDKLTVRWYSGDQSYGQQMYNLSSDILKDLKNFYGFDSNRQIYLSIYGSRQDFFNAVTASVPKWAGGVTYPVRSEISLIAPQDRTASVRIGEGIPHEVTHAVMYQFVGQDIPRWLDEGFAVFSQSIIDPDYKVTVQSAYRAGRLFDFDSITDNFPSGADDADLAYAQGYSMVDFLIKNYDKNVFANVMNQLRTKTFEQSLKATLGIGLKDIEAQWRNSLGGKKVNLPKPLLSTPLSAQPISAVKPSSDARTVDAAKTTNEPQAGDWLFLGGGLVLVAVLAIGATLYFTRRRPQPVAAPAVVAPPAYTPNYQSATPPMNSYTPPPNPYAGYNVGQSGYSSYTSKIPPSGNHPTTENPFGPLPTFTPPANPYVAPAPLVTPPPDDPYGLESRPPEADPLDIISSQFGSKLTEPPRSSDAN